MPIHFTTVNFRGVQLAKNDFGSVLQNQLQFQFFGSFLPLWYDTRNDIYFRDELVQLIVSQND